MTRIARGELAQRLHTACALTGEFVLRSGQVSDHYFDKYQFEADPELLRDTVEHLAALIPAGTEVLAGLELGGVPVATALSLHTGLPAAMVRKEAKTYGTAKLAEGAGIDGRRVLIVEDIVSTGGQIAISVEELRSRGAIVDAALCVIDRSGGRTDALTAVHLDLLALYREDELNG